MGTNVVYSDGGSEVVYSLSLELFWFWFFLHVSHCTIIYNIISLISIIILIITIIIVIVIAKLYIFYLAFPSLFVQFSLYLPAVMLASSCQYIPFKLRSIIRHHEL